jgi:hypothetical protein
MKSMGVITRWERPRRGVLTRYRIRPSRSTSIRPRANGGRGPTKPSIVAEKRRSRRSRSALLMYPLRPSHRTARSLTQGRCIQKRAVTQRDPKKLLLPIYFEGCVAVAWSLLLGCAQVGPPAGTSSGCDRASASNTKGADRGLVICAQGRAAPRGDESTICGVFRGELGMQGNLCPRAHNLLWCDT